MSRLRLAVADPRPADHPILAVLQPNPVLGFLLQAAALGAFVGTLVGYWRRRSNEEFDTFPIVTRWTVAILLGGSVYALFEALT
jgi:hypothetical protein